ncbi:MAG TPA: pilus assembly protein PilM [Candidatus Magasanikbacteria bacterium]|nr:pilus assembly protein PilM [Candidatus Magasanikbacteria bacterium]
MSLFNKHESYLGVDIGSDGIKIVELRRTKNRPQLWTYGIADEKLDIHLDTPNKDKTPAELIREKNLESAEETGAMTNNKVSQISSAEMNGEKAKYYAEILRELVRQARATSRKAIVSLPVSYVFNAIVNLPKVQEKEIDHLVRAEVKKMLPRPIEEMQVVHQVVPQPDVEKGKEKFLKILVTAAPREVVAFYTRIFEMADLELLELETEGFALERALVGHDVTTSIVVDVGAEKTNFYIMDQGLPMTNHVINLGGNALDRMIADTAGVTFEQAMRMKSDLSVSGALVNNDSFMAVFDPIAKQIEYGFDVYLRQTGNENKKPEKIILTGGTSTFPPLVDYLRRKFAMKVFVGDPWARVVYQQGLKPVLDEIGPRMSVAIGLALRKIV